MKKLKNTFNFVVMAIFLFVLQSCSSLYITKSYSGNQCYQIVDEYLQSQGWEREVENGEVVFLKGQSVKLTFDYDSEGLEVQIHLEKKQGNDFEVSVGNWGMVGEIHLMEKRFKRISAKLDEEIGERCQLVKTSLFLR